MYDDLYIIAENDRLVDLLILLRENKASIEENQELMKMLKDPKALEIFYAFSIWDKELYISKEEQDRISKELSDFTTTMMERVTNPCPHCPHRPYQPAPKPLTPTTEPSG